MGKDASVVVTVIMLVVASVCLHLFQLLLLPLLLPLQAETCLESQLCASGSQDLRALVSGRVAAVACGCYASNRASKRACAYITATTNSSVRLHKVA